MCSTAEFGIRGVKASGLRYHTTGLFSLNFAKFGTRGANGNDVHYKIR
jgi:hypothetical protein